MQSSVTVEVARDTSCSQRFVVCDEAKRKEEVSQRLYSVIFPSRRCCFTPERITTFHGISLFTWNVDRKLVKLTSCVDSASFWACVPPADIIVCY